MGNRKHHVALAAGLLLAACGGGGGGIGNSGGDSGAAAELSGTLTLLQQTPEEGAVQVPLDGVFQFRFDAALALESFGDEDTWLRPLAQVQDPAANVAGTWSLATAGQTAVWKPSQPLLAETDYVLQLSPLTCDHQGRILEREHRLSFRSLDLVPPTVLDMSVAAGAVGVSRTAGLAVTLSEGPAPASLDGGVALRDAFGTDYLLDVTVIGNVATATPRADLPGDRQFTLTVRGGQGGVTDRAGNALAADWSRSFRTAADAVRPVVAGTWPSTGSTAVSPLARPEITFSESMDPFTVEPSSLVFQDQFGTLVPYRVMPSRNQRGLRLEPQVAMQPGRTYTLAFVLGPAAATDVSGNPLAATTALVFTTGDDATPPVLAASVPGSGASRVSPNVVPVLSFSEPLDSAFVSGQRVVLRQGGTSVASVVESIEDGAAIRITPVLPLSISTGYTITLAGGAEGLRDRAGNVLPTDLTLGFTTSGDATTPQVMLLPADGAVAVSPTARISAVFQEPLEPASVHGGTFLVTDENGAPIAGTLSLGRGNRVIQFVPAQAWAPNQRYRTVVRGGPGGIVERSGNWMSLDATAGFRVGSNADRTQPTVTATLNRIVEARRRGMVVPPSGFTIDLEANDPVDQALDPGSFRIEIAGSGPAPGADQIYATSVVGYRNCSWQVPADLQLPPGTYTLLARVSDLSGNQGTSAAVTFEVAAPTAAMLPFERTQVVWVRTDLDRDGNGTADFDDDLVRLGLNTPGDPRGTNGWMRRLVLDGILAQCNALLGRGPRGQPLGSDSVGIRLTTRMPIGVPHMQIALGGLDPEGDRRRAFGDPSTGVLGRAYYDQRNSQTNDRNIASSPGLGVFPAELFLYQARIHIQVYPSFQTLFAQRFLPLIPAMGGTAAGLHQHDAAVLSGAFAWNTATSPQRARWSQVMQAADDWAVAIGIVLTHEVGHAVGLTTPGDLPVGLFGDNTFHNSLGGATEVMAAAVGYESMVSLTYAFRDVNLAYLRQRLLLP